MDDHRGVSDGVVLCYLVSNYVLWDAYVVIVHVRLFQCFNFTVFTILVIVVIVVLFPHCQMFLFIHHVPES